jgi:hypothetical protein
VRTDTYNKACLRCGTAHTITEENDDNAEYNQERMTVFCIRCDEVLAATRCARLSRNLSS